jgi:hypothetical protein
VWSDDPWHALTNSLKAVTGRKGRDLFHPLRLALTGRDSGPDMKALLPLDATPSRRTSGWLWVLWLVAMAAVLALVGLGIYAVAVTF